MKDNTYEFMIKTGKYYPDENIISERHFMFFNQCNDQGKVTYHEKSNGSILFFEKHNDR